MGHLHILQVCKYGYTHDQCSCKGSKHKVLIVCTNKKHEVSPLTEERQDG